MKNLFFLFLMIIALFLTAIIVPIGFTVRSFHIGYVAGRLFRDKLHQI